MSSRRGKIKNISRCGILMSSRRGKIKNISRCGIQKNSKRRDRQTSRRKNERGGYQVLKIE